MIASDLIPQIARPWLSEPGRPKLRLFMPIISLFLVWWFALTTPALASWLIIGTYSLVQLGLLIGQRAPMFEQRRDLFVAAAIVIDLVLATLCSFEIITMQATIYPLAALIALRVFQQRRMLSLAHFAPLALILSYLVAVQLYQVLPALETLSAVTNLWMIIAGVGLIITAVLMGVRQRSDIAGLRQSLQNERKLREARVGELERTTNELRARMREQHAIEEGLRAITSSLSLNEVLQQIVDSTVNTLGRERVIGTALSLMVDGTLTNHTYTRDNNENRQWAEQLARRAMQQNTAVFVNDTIHSAEFAPLALYMRSAIAVPMFIGTNQARGALTVVSPTPAAFSTSDARHLSAFAAQASIAIANAEFHSRMQEQQRLLEAVIRDINDGLVVINASGDVVLNNPIGRTILEANMDGGPARERLLSLAASAYESDQATIMGEFKVHAEPAEGEEEQPQQVYQAFASRLQADAGPHLVAVVLHDITHQRAEEQARTEFISMVSHELRNPLHSLNGFLKVVTQGRAGSLNELQQEFLQMADGQVELLKGRITELLEFNRMKAGKLTLKPATHDLGRLVASTVNRLTLQAEQSNIQLHNLILDDLPEMQFDNERIGQVLTNLIENAIKATPHGGRIAVASQLRDGEVWISVSDTGIGIAPGDVGKIFQRYYRANTQKSVYGSHLGLGLTICQQIVEGHNGRIWVESEQGVGTTFTFSLPLVMSAVEELVS